MNNLMVFTGRPYNEINYSQELNQIPARHSDYGKERKIQFQHFVYTEIV